MKKILSISVILVVNFYMLFAQNQKVKEFNLRNYDGIEVHNSLDVRLIQDGTESISVKCDERLLPAIKVEKNGSLLSFGFDWDEIDKICGTSFFNNRNINVNDKFIKINGKKFNGKVEIVVHAKKINELKAAASGDIFIQSNLTSKNLRLVASSSGDIVCKGLITADNLKIKSSSSGDIVSDFKANNAELRLSSSGDCKGDFNVENIDLSISSSADYTGEINAKKAVFDLSSAAGAKVSGRIDNLYVEASSSADFYGKKIVYEYAEVDASSSASIHISKSGKVVDKTSRRTGVFID